MRFTHLCHSAWCHNWTFQDAIREVLQNTIDGAVEYLESYTGNKKSKDDILQAGSGWIVTKKKPLKAYSDEGYLSCYNFELVLTTNTNWKKPTNLKMEWSRDPESYAYILLTIVSKETVIDKSVFLEKGEKPENTALIIFEASNKILPDFQMMNLANIGKSSKRKRENLAGQYGEGFKSGVKVATSYGFKVDVMDQSEKLDFRIVREKKSFQYKLSNLYKEKIPKQMKKQCKDEPSFVTVRMKLKDPRDLDQIKNNLFFRPRSFRLLTPGINTQINEEKGDFHILKNEENRGEIYCMGIFVQKKPNLLFGYDININVKGLISGRDRNTIVHEIFLECVAESLLQTSSRPLLVELLDLWITLKEGDLRKNIEFQASFDYEDLATLLSQRYQEKKGVETYPCKEEDVKRLQEVFKDPKLDVLESSFVDLLRFGIYRSVNNEIDFFYSEENQYKSISKDEEDILQSALFRLDHVEANRVLYEKIVVVDGTLLTKKLLCKKRDDVIYVNSKAFCSDEKDSPQKLSFQLGYHIAQSADEYGSFGCKYADIQSSSQEWYTFRVTSADFDFTRNLFEVVCCEKLIQRKPILQCLECEDDGDAATSRLISCVELKDKESNIFIKTKPGYKYTFQAVDLSCPVYQSVSQWLDFRFENKFLMNMLEIRDPLTLKFCRELIEIPIEQVVQDEGHVTINEDGDGKNRDSGEVEGSSIQEDGGACDITECIPGMILEQNTNDSVEYGINDLELNSDEEDLDASDSEIESFFCGNDGDDSSYTDNDDESSNESVDEETDIPKAKRQKLTKTYYGKELRKGEVYRHSSYKCVKVQNHESPPSFTVICTLQQSLHKAIPLEPPCHILLEADACVAFPEKLVRFEIQTRKKEFIEGLQYKLTEDEYQEEISDVQYEFSSSEKDTKVDGFFIEWRLQLLETQESFCCQKVPRELVLYAGVGGASIGDHEAGFDVKWLVEKDHLCAASLKSDDWHKNASVYCEDVSIFLEKCEKHEMGYPGPKEVDHIQSSPPCQPWSAANRNAEVGKDTRNKMELLSLCRAVGHFRPKTAVLEQVTGIFRKVHEGRQYLSDLVVNFLSLGYQVRLAVHDSKMFGVPQCRKRLIITLARNDTELPSLPLPTDQLSLHVALKSLKNIKTDSEGSGIVMCGQERTFNHILATEKDTEKVYIDEKCKFVNTIKRNTNLWWSDKDRPFSLRELAGLFSFPLTKQFFGEIQQIRKQLGNAVPSKVAEAIAKEVIKVHHHDNFA